MLEQAIVDAQALREAALKNAEQALIEKFAPQIKEAVETLLEGTTTSAKRKVVYEGDVYNLLEIEDGQATIQKEGTKAFIVSEAELSDASEALLKEEEGAVASAPVSAVEAPAAFTPNSNLETPVQYSAKYEDSVYEFDLSELMMDETEGTEEVIDAPAEEPAIDLDAEAGDEAGDETGDDLLAGLELQEGVEEDDDLVSEIMKILGESDDLLEEELIVDTSEQKHGHFVTDEATREYDEDLRKAKEVAEEKEEENKGLKKENEKLQETLTKFKHKNKQYKDAVEKLSQKLNETLLSNAKLIYSNKTLGDASLNERQKSKIVEAITKARTPEEAKNLCEALNATVTSGTENKSPRTLSESVQRKSNLSGILPRRKSQVNESEEHNFADHMKKLAGIK
jgi:hypothetical protein